MIPLLHRRSVVLAAVAAFAVIAVACGSAADSAGRDGTATDNGGGRATDTAISDEGDPAAGLDPRLLASSEWSTDFSIRSVDLSEFISGGPRKDGIRSIDDPKFSDTSEADEYLADREPVIAVEVNGDARAYPLGILTRHEIVNDVIGGVPVIVTFCPLCNSAIVFERELGGTLYDFGVSGVLRNSDLVMYDRQTETWWQQFTGEAIVGVLTGTLLDTVPSSTVSWGDFKATFPDGQVLSRDTGFAINYGINPYFDYDSDETPFLFRTEPDTRLSPIERVVAVELNGDVVAYPFSLLKEERVIHDNVGGQSIVVFHQPGTASALDDAIISEARDIGASGVFIPEAAGRVLTFGLDGDDIVDNETGTRWNILGKALSEPLAGEELEPVVHADHFWFAWAAFRPETRIFGS